MLLKERKKEGRTKVMGRQGGGGKKKRTHRQLLDEVKEMRGYWKLKEEALDHTLWRTFFGRRYGPVARQTMK
jgi:hypothetical protein